MRKIKQILNAVFPFAVTILLWRMSAPIWNPCGVLALIPIFYYSFVRPRNEFLPMAIIGCLLLDYNFDTMLFWTMLFCAAYAANYFQTALRAAVQTNGGLYGFASFAGTGLFILGIGTWTLVSIGTAILTLVISTTAYWIWGRVVTGR